MTTTITAPPTHSHRWRLWHYGMIATIILAMAAGVLAGYAWERSTSPSGAVWNVPVPFKDGYVPAQPM